MIGHQAPAQHPHASRMEVLLQEPEIGLPVPVSQEHHAAIHPALGNMMRGFREDDAQSPGHDKHSGRHPRQLSQKIAQIRLTPFAHTFFPLSNFVLSPAGGQSTRCPFPTLLPTAEPFHCWTIHHLLTVRKTS